MKRRVFFRADGNENIGLGHLIRSLALADIIKENFDVAFITNSSSEFIKEKIYSVTNSVVFLNEKDAGNSEALSIREYLMGDDIIVLDGYKFDTSYQSILKQAGCKVICIDDICQYHFIADVVINHNPATKPSDYSVESYTKLYLGFEYALLRKQFLEKAKEKRVIDDISNALICIGGADPLNLTSKVLEACKNVNVFKKINVITGGAYQFESDLDEWISRFDSISHFHNLNTEGMIAIMQDSQFAICPSSSVSLELFCIGVNLVTGYFAENQIKLTTYIHEKAMGYSVGNLRVISQDSLERVIVDNIHNDSYKMQKQNFKGDQIQNLKNIFLNL